MQPLQLNHVLELATLAGFEGALCSNMEKPIKAHNFKKMLKFCRDLRTTGQLKKIWNLEIPEKVKDQDLWALKNVCSTWSGLSFKKIRHHMSCPYPPQKCSLPDFESWLQTKPNIKKKFDEMFCCSPSKETARIFCKGLRERWLKNNLALTNKTYSVSGPQWETLNK